MSFAGDTAIDSTQHPYSGAIAAGWYTTGRLVAQSRQLALTPKA